jgi:hypothetical protein
MANEYMTDRAKGSETLQELEALKKELAEIRLAKPIPEEQFDGMTPQDIDAFSNLSDDELKAYIKDKTGTGVRGQPSRDTLLSMARDAA